MSPKISSFSMNLYSTRRRNGGIVPTVQLDMVFATPYMEHAMTVDGLRPCIVKTSNPRLPELALHWASACITA